MATAVWTALPISGPFAIRREVLTRLQVAIGWNVEMQMKAVSRPADRGSAALSSTDRPLKISTLSGTLRAGAHIVARCW